MVVCDDNGLVDRAAAHRAGLGWFGKNSLLLLSGLGSWFVLGSVVTDAPLRPTAAGGPVAPRRRVRELHPLPDRLPDRGAGGAGGARRPPVPGLVGPGARARSPRSTGRRWGTASTGATSASRSAPSTGSPTDGLPPPPPEPRQPSPGSDLLELLEATDGS